jgi:hypothetical protein
MPDGQMTDAFVAVAFEHGRPVRTEYLPTATDAQALVAKWEAEGFSASWASREDWDRLQARSPRALDRTEDADWPLLVSALEKTPTVQVVGGSGTAGRFCPDCGVRVAGGRYCEACGRQLQQSHSGGVVATPEPRPFGIQTPRSESEIAPALPGPPSKTAAAGGRRRRVALPVKGFAAALLAASLLAWYAETQAWTVTDAVASRGFHAVQCQRVKQGDPAYGIQGDLGSVHAYECVATDASGDQCLVVRWVDGRFFFLPGRVAYLGLCPG